jgi:transposase
MSTGKKPESRARRTFSEEFKREAVRLVTERPEGVSFAKIARDLDLRAPQLRVWVKEFAGDGTHRPLPDESVQQELRRLRREVQELRQERDFAKKAAAFFAKGSR